MKAANDLIAKWKKIMNKDDKKVPPTKEKAKDSQPVTKAPSMITKAASTETIPELEDKKHEPFRNSMKKMIYTPFAKHIPEGYTKEDILEKVKCLENEMFTKLNKQQYIHRGKAIASILPSFMLVKLVVNVNTAS